MHKVANTTPALPTQYPTRRFFPRISNFSVFTLPIPADQRNQRGPSHHCSSSTSTKVICLSRQKPEACLARQSHHRLEAKLLGRQLFHQLPNDAQLAIR